jgi:hypothetical protein
LLQDLPELANVGQQYYSVLLSQLFPMMLTNPFSSAQIIEEVLAYAKLKISSHHFQQADTRVTAMTGAAMGDR